MGADRPAHARKRQLTELREPSAAMLRAATAPHHYGGGRPGLNCQDQEIEIWQPMIDAALRETDS